MSRSISSLIPITCSPFVRNFRKHIEDQTESILETKLRDLELRWERFQGSYEAAMMARDDSISAAAKQDIKDRCTVCSEAYYNCHAQMLDLLKIHRSENPANPRFQSTAREYLPAQQTYDSSDYIKLPPCDTEVFNGSYEQWPSFRDMFTAVYINHSKLSPVTKLYHLRNKTRGEAGAILKRYPLSHDNFDIAWNALKSRYENKRVLVDNQIRILFDIPAARNEDSESLRRIQSSVSDSLAALKTLGIEVESWNPILIRLISTKLPDKTLALWEQSLTSPRELPKWSQMSQFLVDRYEAVERLASIRGSKDFSISPKTRPNLQSYASLENLSPLCKLCEEAHTLRECPKFRALAVQQRVDFVFQNKLCNNCLATSHLKANCKSRHTCLHCKKMHHTLLHMGQNPKTTTPEKSLGTALSNPQVAAMKAHPDRKTLPDKSYMDERPSTSKKVHANCCVGTEHILLRTALVQVECRGELFTMRALIDPGSQRTFLTEKVRSRLQLPYKKTHLEIIGIGGQKQPASKECELILYAKRHNIRIPIKAIVLPKVTKHLPACSFKIPLSPELYKLDLADPSFNRSTQVDLILGNDYEHFLNVEGIKKNVCGQSSTYNTIFG